MASKFIHEKLQSFRSWMTSSLLTSNDNQISGICWLLDLPPEIIQMFTDYLNVNDLISFSRTCRTFYTLINNDNFWMHRIHRQLPHSIAQLYTIDVYQPPEMIQTIDEPRHADFLHVRTDSDFDKLANSSATHYNDEVIERRHDKMYVSNEDFLKHVNYFQFKTPSHHSTIPFMKLVYFYLIDRKRRAAASMDVIHLDGNYLADRTDQDSLTGHIIQLRSVCWLELTGRFQQRIMPGKYEVSWRMKGRTGYVTLYGETEFLVVPSHGKLLIKKIEDNDFRNYVLQQGDRWFTMNMGEIIIYKPSIVWMAIRNWNNGNWKSGLSWDCIELRMIP
ncbi:hypothetical protein I4U23_026112 [Adineta vaga]|nr:hypothetical protein I4U23_026112 [Adineta vaga]